jgi:hypothetical protein
MDRRATLKMSRTSFQLSAEGIRDPSVFEGGWYAPQTDDSYGSSSRHSRNGARIAEFMEHEKGSIEEGKLADLVILSKDIMTIEPKEILSTEVEVTIVGGVIRYTKK